MTAECIGRRAGRVVLGVGIAYLVGRVLMGLVGCAPSLDTQPTSAGGGHPDSPVAARASAGQSIRFYYFGLAPGVYHLYQGISPATPAWWGDVPAARPSKTRIWWIDWRTWGDGTAYADTLWLRDPHARLAGGLRMRAMTGATRTTTGTYELRRSW